MAHITKVSPFAPPELESLPPVPGVALAVCESEAGYKGRDNLLLAAFREGTVVAGALTQSKTRSAPVDWCRRILERSSARAVVVNAGNANAFTGKRGAETARITAEAGAAALGCDAEDVYIASTGVIAEPLAPEPFERHLPVLARNLADDAWHAAARAIMTTDTFPKVATRTVEMGSGTIVVNGIAKGSGMIAPDMATMLAFVFTDAAISPGALQEMTTKSCARTFNSISVDTDTSTSDTLLVFATGNATERGVAAIDKANVRQKDAFAAALHEVMHDLAMQIVKDGEGISKLIEAEVSGAVSDKSATRIARAIVESPLVKTAIAGEDANWGRVVMAVGKAGEPADRDLLSIKFGDIVMAVDGERAPSYDEATVTQYMKGREIRIAVDLGLGSGRAKMWGCDLTHEYISINADYRS